MTTLKDIAERANVSTRAVGYALTGGGRIGADTSKRIQKIAHEMGYRPNVAARSTRTGRFNCATLLLGTDQFRSNLPTETLASFHDSLRKHRMHMHLMVMSDQDLTSDSVMRDILIQSASDGLLVNYYYDVPPQLDQLIARYMIPAIWLNRKLPTHAVYMDDVQLARLGTQALLQRGHRRIAYLDMSAGADHLSHLHYSHRDRQLGYEQVMREAKLEPVVWRQAEQVLSVERVVYCRAMLSKDAPTAVLSYGATNTYPLLIALQVSGLRCPHDVSVVEFSETQRNLGGFSMARVEVPSTQAARLSVHMLLQLIKDSRASLPSQSIGGEFEMGQSVTSIL